ncbi:metallophosphoesterase [Anaeromyxobacter sp. Fw109-5]|nr:metallophosphoesterase [Anaeromyxobacter sp. Fw109-5]
MARMASDLASPAPPGALAPVSPEKGPPLGPRRGSGVASSERSYCNGLMTTSVFVISDLHFGGAEGFRMCSSDAVKRLSALVDWIAQQRTPGRDVHLVLNGDTVDFLAEKDADGKWSAFTASEDDAVRKLEQILGATREFWVALARFVASKGALTLALGNHDIELSLPRVRARLLSEVAPEGGRIAFLHDNEAFRLGKLLVEHGNRYDGWNVVDHDALRRVRSALSRAQPPQAFPAQPGSEMVARVMNPIKATYAFVDLLKPETSAVAPILAVLNPGLWKMTARFVRDAAAAANRSVHLRAAGPAADSGYVAAQVAAAPGPALPPSEDEGMRLADELSTEAAAASDGNIGFMRDVKIELLLRAFRNWREKDRISFAIDDESTQYLDAANALASRGFEVVVFGHTHLAKRIALPNGATYLNSGTWADVMRIPDIVYEGDAAAGQRALRTWLDELEHNRIDRYRRMVPTFVRVDLEPDGRIAANDVLFFDGPANVEPITTAGVIERLGVKNFS